MRAHRQFGYSCILLTLVAFACLAVVAQEVTAPPAPQPALPADPAYPVLERAYRELKAHNLEAAAAAFREAARLAPDRANVHKELGFTCLQMGETRKAIEAFEHVYRLAPGDAANVLSLGYLYIQVNREPEALEMFERAARGSDPVVALKASETLARVQKEYAEQTAHWERAIRQDPKNVSARLELASICRKNRNFACAVEQYTASWHLLPGDLQVLLDIARAYDANHDAASARAFYLLAWRAPDPRVSELGRAGLGAGYPAPEDFARALEFDPANLTVRRDLAYLYLNLGRPAAAIPEFEKVAARQPEDWQSILQLAFLYLDAGRAKEAEPLLDRVMKHGTPEQARKASEALLRSRSRSAAPEEPPSDASRQALEYAARGLRALAANQFEAAAENLETAYRLDPQADGIALRLGWIYNMMRRDQVALRWFRKAETSADVHVAVEARRAARNLAPALRRITYSFWANPVLSSRWQDMFGYAQWKAELRRKRLPFRPYLSVRFNGDTRTRSGNPGALFFSDGGATLGVGVFIPLRRDLNAWAEAGNSLSYYARPVPGTGRLYPDYRAGLTWFRAYGPSLFTDLPGYRRFADAAVANLFISRYSNDLFHYVQTRSGYHLPRLGLLNTQAYLAANYVRDVRRFYWANFAEAGPGLTLGFRNFPQMQASLGLLRGVYTTNKGNPRRPNFLDLRLNVWFSRSF